MVRDRSRDKRYYYYYYYYYYYNIVPPVQHTEHRPRSYNKKLSYRREAVRCLVLLSIFVSR